MRNTKIKRIMATAVILSMLLTVAFTVTAAGNSLNLLTRSTSLEKGDDFRMVIEIAATEFNQLTSFGPIRLSYDPTVFTYRKSELIEGNIALPDENKNGEVSITWYSNDGSTLRLDGNTYLVGIYFTASKVGQGTFTVTHAEGFGDENLDEHIVTYGGASKTVYVSAPIIKSDNSNLKSLQVSPGTLTPAFSAGTTSYAMTVDPGVDKVTVSAVASDAKASVSVSGNTGLIEGDNTVRVVVTAENGEKKTYTIVVTRAGPSPTPSPSPTPAVTVNLPGGDYAVMEPPEGTTIPTGFYSTLDTMDGQSVPAFKALQGDLTLFYLSMEDGDDGFYYYSDTHSAWMKFLTLDIPAMSLPILTPDESVEVPEGFTQTTMSMGGEDVPAWQLSDNPADGEYLLYLLTTSGAKNFYLYNQSSRVLTVYAGSGQTTVPTGDETDPTEPTDNPDKNASGAMTDLWQIAAFVLGIICLILIGIVIWLVLYQARHNGSGKSPKVEVPPIKRVE